MIGPFLLLIGLFLLYVAAMGKSLDFLKAMKFPTFESEEEKLDKAVSAWMTTNVWNPLKDSIKNALPAFLRIG